jgi:proline dehydrogenase
VPYHLSMARIVFDVRLTITRVTMFGSVTGRYARDQAAANGWQPGEYEFEMLLGVRGDVAATLAAEGERVRLYVPFGRDWWPYAVRRRGESGER